MKKMNWLPVMLAASLPVQAQNKPATLSAQTQNQPLTLSAQAQHKPASLSAQAQNKPDTYTLQGTIKGIDTGWVYFSYDGAAERQYIRDSARLIRGKFSLSGAIESPSMAYLYLKEMTRNEKHSIRFFIEPAAMQITLPADDFSKALVKGSRVQDEFKVLNDAKAPIMQEEEPFLQAYIARNNEYIAAMRAKKDERTLDSLKSIANEAHEKLDPFGQRSQQVDIDFFAKHPQSYVTAYYLRFYTSEFKADKLQQLYERLGATIQQHKYGQSLAKQIADLKQGSPGSMATNFAGTDINGQPLQLTDFRGKYVLVDFWASWCVPCRKGNPHLLKLYAQYKEKGLEIIGVSDDDSKPEAWKAAVAKDGIGVWKHVLRGLKRTPEGGYDKSEDKSEAYGISSLPTKVLIDPNGKIIGRFGGGGDSDEAMDAQLAAIFK